MLQSLADRLVSLAFPTRCRGCEANVETSSDGAACGECWEKTRIFTSQDNLCRKCGSTMPLSNNAASGCRKCDDHLYDRAVAVGVYEHALLAAVLELKLTPKFPARLSQLLIAAFERANFSDSTLIVPVPLSAKRLIERGFNQADLIADVLVKATGLPSDPRSLVRRIHTPVHRAGMDRKARELTVKNAFEVNRPNLIDGQNILLVDDIFTSGATVSYCSKALKKYGAARVDVLTLARAEYR